MICVGLIIIAACGKILVTQYWLLSAGELVKFNMFAKSEVLHCIKVMTAFMHWLVI